VRRHRVKELLEGSGKNCRDLAVYLDVSEDTSRRLLRPDQLVPSKYIAPLTEFFDVTADYLLGLDRDNPDQLALPDAVPAKAAT